MAEPQLIVLVGPRLWQASDLQVRLHVRTRNPHLELPARPGRELRRRERSRHLQPIAPARREVVRGAPPLLRSASLATTGPGRTVTGLPTSISALGAFRARAREPSGENLVRSADAMIFCTLMTAAWIIWPLLNSEVYLPDLRTHSNSHLRVHAIIGVDCLWIIPAIRASS